MKQFTSWAHRKVFTRAVVRVLMNRGMNEGRNSSMDRIPVLPGQKARLYPINPFVQWRG